MLVGSSTLFGLMAFLAKLSSARISGAQVAMIRFALCLIPMLMVPSWRRATVTFQRFDLLFYRGFFGGLAVLFYFIAIERIPVGLATLLNYTAPIFSGFFAWAFIGEPVKLRILLPLVITFSGVIVVVQAHSTPGEMLGFGPWEALGLLSAILSGAAVTAIRVARRTEGSWSIFASFSLFGLLATAPLGILQWRSPTWGEWSLLIGVAVTSFGAQLLMTSAMKWVEAVTAGILAQLAVVISMILGAIWLNERFTAKLLLGSALTISGVIFLVIISSRPAPSAFDEAPEQ
jgi:drug/metabolite transporter (DMT)-like permease